MNHPVRDEREQRGFTLVELMVVIVILGLLATIVGTNVLGHTETARIEAARSSAVEIHKAATIYATKNGKVPSLEDLIEPDSTGNPYIEGGELPIDPWSNQFELRQLEGRLRFEVVSYGPDGFADTEDDIVHPKRAVD